jgi:hypothetical protein
MATLESIQASLDRMEREQKVRDRGILQTFDIFTNEVKRLQQMLSDHEREGRLPMEMGDFMRLMTVMLDRQQQLLESLGQQVEDGGWLDEVPGIIPPADHKPQ